MIAYIHTEILAPMLQDSARQVSIGSHWRPEDTAALSQSSAYESSVHVYLERNNDDLIDTTIDTLVRFDYEEIYLNGVIQYDRKAI